MGKQPKRQKAKGKPQKPSIKIPSSPSSASKGTSAAPPNNDVASADSHSNLASPFQTPPTSPSTLATDLPSMDSAVPQQFDSSQSESQEGKNETEKEKDMQEQIPILSPEQSHHQPREELQKPANDPEQLESPVQELEGPQSLVKEQEQSQSSVQEREEPQPSAEDQEELQPPAEGRERPQSPVQKQDDPQPPAEDQEEPQLPAEDQERSQSSAQERDGPQSPAEGQVRSQTPAQGQEFSEQEQEKTQALPEEENAAQLQPPVQEQEQALRQEQIQSQPPEHNRQPSLGCEPEPESDPSKQQQQTPTETYEQITPITAINASDVASKDILAVANVLATMKTALISMANAFDRLGSQTEKMVSLTLDLKAADQIRRVQFALEEQIAKHKAEIESLRSSLKTKIKNAVEEKIRTSLLDVVRGSIQEEIEEKVRYQLSIQIPEDLRRQVISHKRQILEVKTTLHNSEARRYNALQTVPGPHARLRPLLRPLPTPEQSPIILISRSSSMGTSTLPTPATAFPPQVPAPTPIKRVTSSSLRSALVPETVPPTPSLLFPRDLTALFALSQDEARRLLREYGLDSATTSPTRESMRPRGLSIVNEESSDTVHDEDPDIHARDLNKFMKHIGVPFLMIPAPKEKIDLSAPLSSKSRRKLLTPLIIK